MVTTERGAIFVHSQDCGLRINDATSPIHCAYAVALGIDGCRIGIFATISRHRTRARNALILCSTGQVANAIENATMLPDCAETLVTQAAADDEAAVAAANATSLSRAHTVMRLLARTSEPRTVFERAHARTRRVACSPRQDGFSEPKWPSTSSRKTRACALAFVGPRDERDDAKWNSIAQCARPAMCAEHRVKWPRRARSAGEFGAQRFSSLV